MSTSTVGFGEACEMLHPGQLIRPQMTEQTAVSLIEKLYGLKVTHIKELNSYDDKNYFVQVSLDYQNPHITELWPPGYILKVLNSMDSQKFHVDAEHEMEHILLKAGFNCPCPVKTLEGQDRTLEKINTSTDDSAPENNNEAVRPAFSVHIVRLLTFIDGTIMHKVPYTPELLFDVGRYIARLEKTLQGFSHPALTNHQTIWNLSSTPKLRDFVYALREERHRHLINQIIEAFSQQVVPLYPHFEKGVIHGDYNEQNILVEEVSGSSPKCDRHHQVCGVIDFGDSSDSFYVFEVAILIMYMMVESYLVDPMLVGGHVLAGYLSVRPLNQHEMAALKVCVAARYAQSLTMGEYSYSLDPGNEYLLVTAKNGWPQLEKLWATPEKELYRGWRAVLGSYNAKP